MFDIETDSKENNQIDCYLNIAKIQVLSKDASVVCIYDAGLRIVMEKVVKTKDKEIERQGRKCMHDNDFRISFCCKLAVWNS